MTRRILKYAVPVATGNMTFTLGAAAEILHVGAIDGNDTVQFWVIDNSNELVKEARTFFIVGTGHVIPDGAIYRGTAIAPPFVWHLFERGELA